MKSFDNKKIGEKLRKAREYLELTQEQVAKILGVGRDAIIRIEKGSRKITAEELSDFSRLYNVSMDDIVNDKIIMTNEQVYARGFENLSEKDQKEILDLIKLKNEIKAQMK